MVQRMEVNDGVWHRLTAVIDGSLRFAGLDMRLGQTNDESASAVNVESATTPVKAVAVYVGVDLSKVGAVIRRRCRAQCASTDVCAELMREVGGDHG